jgi:toxin ParE1/3/4
VKTFRVVFSEEADRHLLSIWQYLAERGGPEAADRFVRLVTEKCAGLSTMPDRGSPRDDLKPGMRTVPIPRRATIGYVVTGDDVVVVGIGYRGQDMSKLVAEGDELGIRPD